MKTKKKILLSIIVSVLINSTILGQDFERKGYIGTMLGPSIPIGEFASDETFYDGYAKTGINLNLITFGYQIWKKIGITGAWFGIANPIDFYGRKGSWANGAIMLGPIYSIFMGEKTILDLMVMSGVVYESREFDADNYAYAYGPGYEAGILLRYNFAQKWGFLFNIGAFNTGLDIQPTRDPEVTLFNLSFGVAYRLK